MRSTPQIRKCDPVRSSVAKQSAPSECCAWPGAKEVWVRWVRCRSSRASRAARIAFRPIREPLAAGAEAGPRGLQEASAPRGAHAGGRDPVGFGAGHSSSVECRGSRAVVSGCDHARTAGCPFCDVVSRRARTLGTTLPRSTERAVEGRTAHDVASGWLLGLTSIPAKNQRPAPVKGFRRSLR